MKAKLFLLVLGVAGGAAAMHFGGDSIRRAAGVDGREIEALILEEVREDDGRLVLMLNSEGESMLASFRERADDVAALVHVGDTITLRAPRSGVFSDDVLILSVRPTPESEEDEEDGEGEGEAEEDAADEADAEELAAESDAIDEPAGEGAEEPSGAPESPAPVAEAPSEPEESAES